MCVVSRGKEEGGSTGVQLCSPLPERDINKVISEPVGLIKSDAMLYCYEDWNPEQPVDARGMSDGTLRFIAIVVALLAVAPHSLLLIEEVDNGLHPSRSKELVDMLKDLSRQRQVDVLCTTHNPVLLDELSIVYMRSIRHTL